MLHPPRADRIVVQPQAPEALGLRGYDSVRLATALELRMTKLSLMTWARVLARAVERVGLGVAGSG